MAVENETADQVVRMVLQGSEVVLKLSGEAALKVATMIYNALKGDLTTKGRATLWEFMKSGKEQKMFSIPDTHLKAFTMASKKYGFPFVVLKDKSSKDGFTSNPRSKPISEILLVHLTTRCRYRLSSLTDCRKHPSMTRDSWLSFRSMQPR